MGGITQYVIKRLWSMTATFFLISILLFLAINLLPGDVTVMITGEFSTKEQIELMREHLGLNRPLYNNASN